jgi:hypothetical protein
MKFRIVFVFGTSRMSEKRELIDQPNRSVPIRELVLFGRA